MQRQRQLSYWNDLEAWLQRAPVSNMPASCVFPLPTEVLHFHAAPSRPYRDRKKNAKDIPTFFFFLRITLHLFHSNCKVCLHLHFFFFSSLLPPLPPLHTLQYSISFQVQSPISYLANTFSTSVKFIFCNFIGFPPVSQVEGKGSHYSLVLQPCPPPSTQPGEEGEKKKKKKRK